MKFRGDECGPGKPVRAASAPSLITASVSLSACILAAAVLADCTMDGTAGSLMVDPGHYSAYHCDQLATRGKELAKREKELHDLITRADESSAGMIIGTLAYRSDYEAVLAEEKILQREEAEKKCEVAPAVTGDQTVR